MSDQDTTKRERLSANSQQTIAAVRPEVERIAASDSAPGRRDALEQVFAKAIEHGVDEARAELLQARAKIAELTCEVERIPDLQQVIELRKAEALRARRALEEQRVDVVRIERELGEAKAKIAELKAENARLCRAIGGQ